MKIFKISFATSSTTKTMSIGIGIFSDIRRFFNNSYYRIFDNSYYQLFDNSYYQLFDNFILSII